MIFFVIMFYVLIQFLEITYCILSASKGIEEVFSLNDYRDILVPVVFLLLNLSYIMFSGVTEAMEFVGKYWPTYGFFVQMLFPFFIFISGIIKKKFFKKPSGQNS